MMLYLKFIFFVFIYLISNNKWVLVESSGSEADPEPGTDGAETPGSTDTQLKPEVYSMVIKLFKADANDSKTVELAKSEYKVKNLGDEHLYVFNSGVNCNLLKIDDKEVWKYDTNKNNAKYPKVMRVNKRFKFVLVEFDGTVKVLIKHTDGKWTPFELDIKLFKDDPDGNKAVITETDFYEDQYLGNLTYAFKPGVKCTKVKFGDKDVWKKRDQGLDEPKSVTYNFMHRIVVREAKKSVFYKKDNSGNWVYHDTIEREEQDKSAKSSGDSSTSQSGSPESGLSSPKPGDGTSTVTPELTEDSEEVDESLEKEAGEPARVAPETGPTNEVGKDTGLRGTGASTEASEEAEESTEKEANDTSGVTSESPEGEPETGSGTGLRGTSGSADSGEKADETASSPSGGADTSEENEKGSEDQQAGGDEEKEANNEEEKETGGYGPSSSHVAAEPSESTDPGVTAQTAGGADAFSSGPASPTANEGSDKDTSGGEGTQTADGGSGTDTSSGEGTETADGSADNSSQTSGGDDGSKIGEEDTGTGGGDGSSATPPASSGGHVTSSGGGTGQSDAKGIKLLKADFNDANKTIEIPETDYKLKKVGDDHLYTFNDGVKCTLLKIDNEEVWKYDSSKHNDKYPKVINVQKKLVVIYFEGGSEVYKKGANGWRLQDKSEEKAKSLSSQCGLWSCLSSCCCSK